MKDYTEFPLLICDGCYLDVPGERIAIALAGGHKNYEANARRIQSTWNACLGIDFPEDCPPGILADLVTVSRGLLVLAESPRIGQGDIPSGWPDKAREILAKLAPAGSPDNGKPAPVSPPEPEPETEPAAPLIAGFTLFRSREDLDAYYKELNEMGEGGGPSGDPYEPPVDRPDFPFFGRQILDDNGWPEDFQTIGGEDAYAMAQALDSNVTRF